MLPSEGTAVKPETPITENEYVALGSVKLIKPDVDEWVVPAIVTDQLVPDGNPFSVNVTV